MTIFQYSITRTLYEWESLQHKGFQKKGRKSRPGRNYILRNEEFCPGPQ